MKRHLLFWLCTVLAAAANADLIAMDNDDLRTVGGQNGVALALDLGLNISNAGAGAATVAIPTCSPTGSSVPCRIAIQLNNRDNLAAAATTFVNAYGGNDGITYSNGSGEGWWLVYKNVYGRLVAPRVTLDAGTATYTNTSGASASVPALIVSTNDASGNPTPIILNNITIQNIGVNVDAASSSTAPQPPANLGYESVDESGFLSLKINDMTGLTLRGTVNVFACQSNHANC